MSSQALPAQAKQLFQYLFEQASLGIAVEDLEGTLLLANPALCSMLGYREDELCGMSCSQFANPEDSEDDWALFQQLRAGVIDKYSLEKRYVSKHRGQIWGHLNVSLLRNGDGEFPLVFALVEDITEHKRSEEALSSMSLKLIEAHEQERNRIGRELHDDIAQRLALVAVQLDQVQQDIPDSRSELGRRIGDLRNQATDIAKDVQLLSHELHSSKLEYLGIVEAAKNFCREFGERQRVEIDFQSHDMPAALPTDLSLPLFRVLQEALRNAAKHSGVKSFEVKLWGSAEDIQLTISDLGIGFDSEATTKGPGLGLTSMQERLRLVGGEFSINSQPRLGTTIHARVHLNSGRS